MSSVPAAPADPQDRPVESLSQIADPQSWLDKALQYVPRFLSSKVHVLFLGGLGIYLVILPLAHIAVSSKAELIGGNYTNVTSDIGACIAAGGTLHLIRQGRKRSRLEEERLRVTQEIQDLLHKAHPEVVAEMQRLRSGSEE
ncbi:MAG TPA: hypothetical protein VIA06_14575 [Candidatus Dormibacteraeota bacterium]|nr:hypothetical protein [Candidatus Dormibacteraeota bacterium]